MPKQWKSAPALSIDPSKRYSAIIDTSVGSMHFMLHAQQTPKTVNNFAFLAAEGFYEGTIFHRVIADFMAQGGDPTGTGTGGPGYRFEDEIDPSLRHDRPGILSMANAGPNTNGSQFFITHVPTPWLDGKHTVFGQLTAGHDVLMSIKPRDPSQRNNPAVSISKITVTEALQQD